MGNKAEKIMRVIPDMVSDLQELMAALQGQQMNLSQKLGDIEDVGREKDERTKVAEASTTTVTTRNCGDSSGVEDADDASPRAETPRSRKASGAADKDKRRKAASAKSDCSSGDGDHPTTKKKDKDKKKRILEKPDGKSKSP